MSILCKGGSFVKITGNYKLLLYLAAAVVNVTLSTAVQKLSLSFLFLDAIGTIFIAVLFDPWYGISRKLKI